MSLFFSTLEMYKHRYATTLFNIDNNNSKKMLIVKCYSKSAY